MLNQQKISNGKGMRSSIVIDSNVVIDTFDPESPNYADSFDFMTYIISNEILFAMPMHGWFEISCTLNRIKKNKGINPPIIDGAKSMLIEFIHIDDEFLANYASVDVPIIKAMDHLFLVVAKKNKLPLVTWDKQMTNAGLKCEVDILNPRKWLSRLNKG
jgi:predicted nucleic acid-binding protein